MNRPLVFFDDTCGLCRRALRFHRGRAVGKGVRAIGRGTEEGRGFLREGKALEEDGDSLVFVDDEGVHTHSEAVLRLSGTMRRPWPLVGRLLRAVPRGLRDSVYRFVARHRRRGTRAVDEGARAYRTHSTSAPPRAESLRDRR